MVIKKENDLNNWIHQNIKNDQNQKEKTENLPIDAQFELMFNLKEKRFIHELFELSNERIAIKFSHELKIYSLKTFKLLTKMNDDLNYKYIELKNKDLVAKNVSFIYFYKLLYTGNYQLFQTIDEKSFINNIIKIMQGNLLLSCNKDSINIYGKEGKEYKLLSQNNNEEYCLDAIEIEENNVVIFKYYVNNHREKYQLFLYDILNKNKKIIMDDFYSSGIYERKYLNMIKNDEYLFVYFEVLDPYKKKTCIKSMNNFDRYHTELGYIFNLGKEKYLECVFDKFPDKSGRVIKLQTYLFKDIYISPLIKTNYNNNTMIAVHEDKIKLLKFQDKKFLYEEFPFEIKSDCKCVKIKNNNFIFYFDNQMILIKHIK